MIEQQRNKLESPIHLIVIPGLLSSIHDHYVQTFLEQADILGLNWSVVNYRGINCKLLTGRPFSFDDFSSFSEPISEIIEQNPDQKFCLVGFSLGGNYVTNLVVPGEDHLKKQVIDKISAVFAVQPPFDLLKTRRFLETELGGFHNIGFLFLIKNFIKGAGGYELVRDRYQKNRSQESDEDFDSVWKNSRNFFDF